MSLMGVGLMMGAGCSVIASIYLSKGKTVLARATITQAMLFVTLISVTVGGFILAFPEETARMLGSSEHLLPLVVDYLVWFSPSLLFELWIAVALFAMRLDGAPKLAMWCSIIAAAVNVVLDWLFIFPLGWGVMGAAFATSLSCLAGAAVAMGYLLFYAQVVAEYDRGDRPQPVSRKGAFMNTNWNDPNFQGFGGRQSPFGKRPPRPKKEHKAIGTPLSRTLINLAVTLIFAAVYFYVVLPPINLQAEEFYFFMLLCCAVYCGCAVLTSGFQGSGAKGYFGFVKKQCRIPMIIAVALVAVAIVGGIVGWQVIRAGSYRDLLTVETGDFATEVEEISYDQIPMLDKDSAEKLGNRKLGELSDMVSQFEVAEEYTQINYKGRPVRVTPLRYGDWIKWFNNRSEGLPAYLIIDMVTQNVEVVRLEQGIRYTTAEHFGRNLYRYLQFHYPTYIFDKPAFEIDEEGNPYWVCPRIRKTIGLFGGTDIDGAVLVNAVTGEHQYYDAKDVPDWVDHVYTADLIVQQYDYHGTYIHGFINSLFGQRDVTVTTDGYNYIAIGDDVYMYTGITSVVSDQSNIGFILSNQRTKETRFYSVAGAEEYSAMDSARGQVQQMNYTATFPLLLNIADQPSYFMALKDAAGLVKMYAMVNVSQYQIVATGGSVAECESNYRQMLARYNLIDPADTEPSASDQGEVTGVIADLRSAVMDGNTWYYLQLSDGTVYYTISAAEAPEAVILNVGDTVTVKYAEGEGSILQAYSAAKAVPAA